MEPDTEPGRTLSLEHDQPTPRVAAHYTRKRSSAAGNIQDSANSERFERTSKTHSSRFNTLEPDGLVDNPEIIDAEVVSEDEKTSWRHRQNSHRRHVLIPKGTKLIAVAAALGLSLTNLGCSTATTEVARIQHTQRPVEPVISTIPREATANETSTPVQPITTTIFEKTTTSTLITQTTTPTQVSQTSDPIFPQNVMVAPDIETTCPVESCTPTTSTATETTNTMKGPTETVESLEGAFAEYDNLRAQVTRKDLPPSSEVPWALAAEIVARFPEGEQGKALAIAWCESSWGSDERAFRTDWPDAGWMQINRFWHEWRATSKGYTWDDVRIRIDVNIALAFEIWAESGWDAWTCATVLE